MSEPPKREPNQSLDRMREQFRLQRHRQILDTALRVMTDEGISAVSMQRIADEMECAIGTIYQYVASKAVLIAELQREAVDVLSASFTLHRSHVDEAIDASDFDGAESALARIVGATWFWIHAEEVFPRQVELCRQLFTDPVVHLHNEANRVAPTALRMFDRARILAEEAAIAGALHPGASEVRAVVVIAGTTGVLLTSGLARFDPTLFNGTSLALELAQTLFLGWGADPEQLTRGEVLLAGLAQHGRIVPAVPT